MTRGPPRPVPPVAHRFGAMSFPCPRPDGAPASASASPSSSALTTTVNDSPPPRDGDADSAATSNPSDALLDASLFSDQREALLKEHCTSRPHARTAACETESRVSSDDDDNDIDDADRKPPPRFKLNKEQKVLLRATILAFLFMICEIIGGYISQSVAIASDAAHMFSDVSGYVIALAAAYLSARGVSRKYPFGYKRVEVLGALFSVLLIWVVTVGLVYESLRRLANPEPVNTTVMMGTAALGIAFNVLIFLSLGGQHHHHYGMPCSGHAHAHHAGTELKACVAHNGVAEEAVQDLHCSGQHSNNGHTHGLCASHQHHAHSSCAHAPAGHASSHPSPKPAHHHQHHHQHHHHMDAPDCHHHHSCSRPHSVLHVVQTDSGCDHAHSHPSLQHCIDVHSHGPCDGDELNHSDSPHVGHSSACGGGSGGHAGCAHGHDSLNVRGAVLHALGDLLQSVGVLVAGVVMWLQPAWWWADPVTTLLFSVVVFWTTKPLIKDITGILMQRAPVSVDTDALEGQLLALKEVSAINRLSVWSISGNYHVVSAHVVVVEGSESGQVIRKINSVCRAHGVRDITVQID